MAPKKQAAPSPEYDLELRFGRTKNTLKMGVVGLPNVGKSSFFNLLTSQEIEAQNFPFCTINPNFGRTQVPDDRYDRLCKIWQPPSMHPAYLNVTDIAGLVRGASKGEGLGNEFLANIQAVDGIYHMVRLFDDSDVVHVDDSVDPVRDLETITHELCLKDLAYFEKEVERAHRDAKKSAKVMPSAFVNTMAKVKEFLESDQLLGKQQWSTIEVQKINEFLPDLITTKPVVYLLNMSTKNYLTKRNKWLAPVFKWIQEHGGGTILPISVTCEERLMNARKDGGSNQEEEECEKIKREIGVVKHIDAKTKACVETDCMELNLNSSLNKIIKAGYEALNLIQFFTTGPTEVRSWTVYKGATAPQCAGVIHNDMERCFIKAEVVACADFLQHTPENQKSMAAVKAAGKHRQEGKNYVAKDGDIIHIMHNAKR